MNNKHLIWIIPLCIFIGIIIGFYFAIPERIEFIIGYDNATLEFMKQFNLTGIQK